MKRTTVRRLLGTLALLLLVAPAFGQREAGEMTADEQAMMEIFLKAGTPGEPHERLAAQVGEYTTVVKSWAAPDAPPVEETGTASRRMILDGRVMVESYKGSMLGRPFSGRGMTGYDNVTGKYWATWNDSMSTGIMVMEGSCNKAMACTFTGSYSDPTAGGPVPSKLTLRWPDENTEIMEMFGPGPDGNEVKMMRMTYTRQ